ALPAGLCEATLGALSAPGPAAVHLAKGVIWSMSLMRIVWPLIAVALLAVAVPVGLMAAGHLSSPPRESAQNVVPVPTPPDKPKADKEDEEAKRKDEPKKASKDKADAKDKGAKDEDPEPAPALAVRAVPVKAQATAIGTWNDARVMATAEEVKKQMKQAENRL